VERTLERRRSPEAPQQPAFAAKNSFANFSSCLASSIRRSNTLKTITQFIAKSVLFAAVAAIASQTGHAQTITPPNVPSNLKVQDGNVPFARVMARGTQNYICLPSGWTFIGPQATLFVSVPWITGPILQQVGTHYLTPNPSETATNRPLWQSSTDSSIVWGKQLEFSDDPNYVQPNAISWLLLQAAGYQNGPAGGTMFSKTTFIQRINTTGGMKPTTACTTGAREFVPYTADYVFYRQASN
jgi:Protein of unknown function (DUF3455)